MAWNGQNQQGPWDFLNHLNSNPQGFSGIGVDHTGSGPQFPQGFPFGGFNPWAHRGAWGWAGPPPDGGRHEWGHHGGRHGRRGRRGGGDEEQPTDQEDTAMLSETEKGPVGEKDDSPDTMRATPHDNHPDPPESVPQPPNLPRHGHGHGFRGRGGRCGGRGMRGHHHHHHHHGPPPPHGPFPWGAGMMATFAQSPFGQGLRDYLNRAAEGGDAANANNSNNNNAEEDVESFQPPVDVFHAAEGWVLHIAVPGAKKEDVGVNWDADKGILSVSGVVYRPGDEAFLQGLVSGERKVGLFSREIKLPPPETEKGEKDDVDSEGITARMEDGVLVVSVPVVEREWTEVRKVDIL